jgi:transcriptional regulator
VNPPAVDRVDRTNHPTTSLKDSGPTGDPSMYIPSAFSETDPARLHDFIQRHSFALLTSQGRTGLFASHVPLLLEADGNPRGRLLGHMARANPQWRDVNGEVMAVFAGPHAYVSPAWYKEPGTVPTWNYVAVHVYGTFHVVEDDEETLEILRRTVATYEASRPEPWVFEPAEPHVETLMKVIVAFRVEITRMEGKWKLSQNHAEGRRRRVERALRDQGDESSRAIAALMREELAD